MKQQKHYKPLPIFKAWLIRRLFKYQDSAKFGDFEEMYNEILLEKGTAKAHWWYMLYIVKSVPPLLENTIDRSYGMFKNYIKVALRGLYRQKLYSVINVFGLAIGITFCLLVYLYVVDEYSYDTFHENKDDLYRVWQLIERPGRAEVRTPATSFPMAPLLKETYPEITHMTRTVRDNAVVRIGEVFYKDKVRYVDPDFFSMFSFEIVHGNRINPLEDLNAVVITKSLSIKYFGKENSVNEQLPLALDNNEKIFTVAAVINDVPSNSTMKFDILVNFEVTRETWGEEWFESFEMTSPESYIMLDQRADELLFQTKLADFQTPGNDDKSLSTVTWKIQPITDIYLNNTIRKRLAEVSDPIYSYMLSGIGVLVLLIASINFIMLSIGRSKARAKEVGVRRVLGAIRSHLINQYLGDALVTSLFALLLGTIFTVLVLPVFNSLFGKELVFSFSFLNVGFALALLCIVGITAGLYPAMVLSHLQPVRIFKGEMRSDRRNFFGKGLVVTQFSITIFLLSATLVMHDQINFFKHKSLGFDKEQVVVFPLETSPDEIEQFFKVLKAEVAKINGVIGISAGSEVFGNNWTEFFYEDEKQNRDWFAANVVEVDYIKTMGLELLEGRDFSMEFGTEASNALIVNEAFAKHFGMREPLAEKLSGEAGENTIIGVIKDFHFASLHNQIEPLALSLQQSTITRGVSGGRGTFPLMYRRAFVRLSKDSGMSTINEIEKTWKRLAPDKPFDVSFLEEDLESQYRNEMKWSEMIKYASIFAIGLACLGLFALTTALVEKRIKEIGIRKVLGASVIKILYLLSRDMMVLVVAANIFAWPLAFYAMQKWLQVFAYRIDIGMSVFFIAACAALAISAISVFYQTMKAALANPVDSLRYE